MARLSQSVDLRYLGQDITFDKLSSEHNPASVDVREGRLKPRWVTNRLKKAELRPTFQKNVELFLAAGRWK